MRGTLPAFTLSLTHVHIVTLLLSLGTLKPRVALSLSGFGRMPYVDQSCCPDCCECRLPQAHGFLNLYISANLFKKKSQKHSSRNSTPKKVKYLAISL